MMLMLCYKQTYWIANGMNALTKITFMEFSPFASGWVEGTRLSDRQRGWAPEAHLETIVSDKTRKRNLLDTMRIATAAMWSNTIFTVLRWTFSTTVCFSVTLKSYPKRPSRTWIYAGSFYLFCVDTRADKGDVGDMATPVSWYSTPWERVWKDAELHQQSFLDISWFRADGATKWVSMQLPQCLCKRHVKSFL